MKRLSDRLASLAVTILLQAAFIALFLQTPHLGAPPRELARELTLILPRLNPAPKQAASPRAVAPSRIQTLPNSISVPPPAMAPPATANLQGIGQSLFGCAPENLAMLTPQDRARCNLGFAPPNDLVFAEPPSHVKDPARRLAELVDRDRPTEVPCVSLKAQGRDSFAPLMQSLGLKHAHDSILMLDTICAMNGLLNGFHLSELPP